VPVAWQRLTDAATCYGIPESTLRRWVAQRRLRSARKGRVLYVDDEDAALLVGMNTRARPPVKAMAEALGGRLTALNHMDGI
jgi:hypothetical protein